MMKSLLTSAGLIATFFVGGLALGQTGPPKPPPAKMPFPPCAQLAQGNTCADAAGLGDCYYCCDSLCAGAGHGACLAACDDRY